jgi:orotate phosphoribosyltransferase-like protein
MEMIPRETLDLVEKIRELKEKKYSAEKISQMLGVSENTVEIISACFDLTKSRRKKKLNKQACLEIVEKYSRGEPISKIAAEYNLSSKTVSRILVVLGVKKSRGRTKKVDVDLLVKMFKEGLSDEEIAERFNVSKQYIATLRSKLGLRKKKIGRPSKILMLEALVDILNERRVVDSIEFYKLTGWKITRDLVETARRLEMPVGYVKIHETSSATLEIFPQEMAGRYIVYKKGYEELAVEKILSMANPRAPMQAVRNRLTGPLLDYIPSTGTVKQYISGRKAREEE